MQIEIRQITIDISPVEMFVIACVMALAFWLLYEMGRVGIKAVAAETAERQRTDAKPMDAVTDEDQMVALIQSS